MIAQRYTRRSQSLDLGESFAGSHRMFEVLGGVLPFYYHSTTDGYSTTTIPSGVSNHTANLCLTIQTIGALVLNPWSEMGCSSIYVHQKYARNRASFTASTRGQTTTAICTLTVDTANFFAWLTVLPVSLNPMSRGRRGNTDPLNLLGSSHVIFGQMINVSVLLDYGINFTYISTNCFLVVSFIIALFHIQ